MRIIRWAEGPAFGVEWTDDPVKLCQEADETLMLPRGQAFGRVAVDSPMNGTPVIGYRAGCTTELLTAGGGMLAPPPDALAGAVVELAAEPKRVAKLRWGARERGRQLNAAPEPAVAVLDLIEKMRGIPKR